MTHEREHGLDTSCRCCYLVIEPTINADSPTNSAHCPINCITQGLYNVRKDPLIQAFVRLCPLIRFPVRSSHVRDACPL